MEIPRNADSQHFVTHRGCPLAYSVVGQGAPVLWIQGTAVHGDGWLSQIASFASDYACGWFDNRGMFRSRPAGDGPITVPQMAEDARVLLDHLGWERAHIVGHSLGGCIAIELALGAPERVQSLSLLCTAANGPGLVAMDLAMVWRGMRMEIGSLRSRRRAFLEVVLSADELAACDPDAVAVELEPIFGHDLAVRPPGTMKQVAAMRGWDASPRLGELREIPTLVAGAPHDVIAKPALYRALAAGIPGARLEELDGAAHGVPVTQAERVNALLGAHFAAAAR